MKQLHKVTDAKDENKLNCQKKATKTIKGRHGEKTKLSGLTASVKKQVKKVFCAPLFYYDDNDGG